MLQVQPGNLAGAKADLASAKQLMEYYERQIKIFEVIDRSELSTYRKLTSESSEEERLKVIMSIHETRVLLADLRVSVAEETVKLHAAAMKIAELESKPSTSTAEQLAEAKIGVTRAKAFKNTALSKLANTRQVNGEAAKKYLCHGWEALLEYQEELLQCKPIAK